VGQLGDGTTMARVGPVQTLVSGAVELAAGENHACIRKADGTTWCWGRNTSGQLGRGDAAVHTDIVASLFPPAAELAVAELHTCARLADGSVRCLGDNTTIFQLGDGTVMDSLVPVEPINLPSAVALVAGARHTCIREANGTVWCWGNNDDGQRGDGTTNNSMMRSQSVETAAIGFGAGEGHTCTLRADGSLWCFGRNDGAQLGTGMVGPLSSVPLEVPLTNVVEVSAAHLITCARRDNGEIWCWGNNNTHPIGDGTAASTSLVPVQIQLSCP
jgi:alpha-tubulin suppressor-like RCC1 family protein